MYSWFIFSFPSFINSFTLCPKFHEAKGSAYLGSVLCVWLSTWLIRAKYLLCELNEWMKKFLIQCLLTQVSATTMPWELSPKLCYLEFLCFMMCSHLLLQLPRMGFFPSPRHAQVGFYLPLTAQLFTWLVPLYPLGLSLNITSWRIFLSFCSPHEARLLDSQDINPFHCCPSVSLGFGWSLILPCYNQGHLHLYYSLMAVGLGTIFQALFKLTTYMDYLLTASK